MAIKITVGPPVLTINRSSTFMVTDFGGEIWPDQALGVFADDTRFVSGYRLLINGHAWQRVSSANVSFHSTRIYLLNPPLRTYGGGPEIAGGTIALRLLRSVDEGIHEAFQITNYALCAVQFVFELQLQSDFADLFEVKANEIREREQLVSQWDQAAGRLTTRYKRDSYLRRFTYEVLHSDAPATYANGRVRFAITLEPGQAWRARGNMLLQHGRRVRRPRPGQISPGTTENRAGQLHERWLTSCTKLETSNEDLAETYRESVEDMGALRLFEQDLGPDVWIPAAGVPWFVTVFGRDSLIASLQNMMVHYRFAEGTLRTLAKYQATERDDFRDAQPGKILHEIRHGELAHFNAVPHARYFGTWDATPLFIIALHQAWRWSADRSLVDDLLPAARRCLEWIDRCGDLDGDGFQEYQTYSSRGYENMSWKDAHDAVVYPNGAQVKQPKALCELQGYVYAAKLGLAELFEVTGDGQAAERLRNEALELKRRFNEAFWLEGEGTYAYGLDPDKRPIATIVSNPGHCLWSGIATPERASRTAERLLASDLWSGWGIRTLSTRNPAYNPFSYQNGSVWPHDNALIALGMHRYGLRELGNRVGRGIVDSAARFETYRLPEVFAGLERQQASFPVQYPNANIPQAWAAGSIFHVVQGMLGLEADAPNRRLWVDPCLPEWVPRLRLQGLRVGRTRVDLKFWREHGSTKFAVEARRGGSLTVEQHPFNSDLQV